MAGSGAVVIMAGSGAVVLMAGSGVVVLMAGSGAVVLMAGSGAVVAWRHEHSFRAHWFCRSPWDVGAVQGLWDHMGITWGSHGEGVCLSIPARFSAPVFCAHGQRFERAPCKGRNMQCGQGSRTV
eukprot:319741-Chlamydomonas_euryale.AAC.1